MEEPIEGWPQWRYGPDGEEALFDRPEDVPAGWQDTMFPRTVALLNGQPWEDAPAKVKKIVNPDAKFDHNGDGNPGGSTAPEPTDDLTDLRAEYKAVVGKRAFPGWDADEIRRRMAAHDAPEIDVAEF